MLANATMAATAADTIIAARKPTMTLSVTEAAAKPTIAERRMLPSRDRFTTPALSEIVSPIVA